MKRPIFSIFFALLTVLSCRAQTPQQSAQSDQELLALVKEVQAQQAQIIANQTKIDSKLAEVAETIRIARIFSSRGGRAQK